MNRSTAREIAVHFAFELAFSDERAEALLARELTPEAFALRGRGESKCPTLPGVWEQH